MIQGCLCDPGFEGYVSMTPLKAQSSAPRLVCVRFVLFAAWYIPQGTEGCPSYLRHPRRQNVIHSCCAIHHFHPSIHPSIDGVTNNAHPYRPHHAHAVHWRTWAVFLTDQFLLHRRVDCSLRSCPVGHDPLYNGTSESQIVECTCVGDCSGGFRVRFRGQSTPMLTFNDTAELLTFRLRNLKTVIPPAMIRTMESLLPAHPVLALLSSP